MNKAGVQAAGASDLDAKVARILARGGGVATSRVETALYLDLAESIVRQAATWQEPDGMIGAHPAFGQDGYHPDQNAHSPYGLLGANLFAGAYHVADQSIPIGPSPADIGGYVLHLPDSFYRLWAGAGPRSEIKLVAGRVEVGYMDHVYAVRLHDGTASPVMEDGIAPNRNGIHRVVVFDVAGPRVSYEATLV